MRVEMDMENPADMDSSTNDPRAPTNSKSVHVVANQKREKRASHMASEHEQNDNDMAEGSMQEDELNEKLDTAASNLWNKFQSIASFVAEKTVEIGKVCGEEMATFADEVKLEASDIYKDHLADKVHSIKETIPKMIPNSLLTYVDGAFPHEGAEELPLEPLKVIE